MKSMRYILALCLVASALEARAEGWLDSDISDILSKVKSIYNEVSGDVSDTAQDFKRQLTSLQQKGASVKETVEDSLDLVQHRRTPFLDFVNGGSVRCGQGSACAQFRAALEDFVLDVADLKTRFPQIEKHGLGDGTILVDVIEHLPPLALFGIHEALQRVPDWQDVPQNLADLYDEIDDPDAFSLELPAPSAATLASAMTRIAGPAGGQGAFGAAGTKTDVFCSKGKQPKWDTVRLNRLKAFFALIKGIFDTASEYAPDWYPVTVAGEGAAVPIPLKGVFKGVADAVDSIVATVDAHRANLGVCKQIETDVAQCTKLLEYRTPAGNKKAYWVVKGIIHAQGDFSPAADALLTEAGGFHRRFLWQQAYQKICDAYAAVT